MDPKQTVVRANKTKKKKVTVRRLETMVGNRLKLGQIYQTPGERKLTTIPNKSLLCKVLKSTAVTF